MDVGLCRWWLSVLLRQWLLVAVLVVPLFIVVVVDDDEDGRVNILFKCVEYFILMYRIEE